MVKWSVDSLKTSNRLGLISVFRNSKKNGNHGISKRIGTGLFCSSLDAIFWLGGYTALCLYVLGNAVARNALLQDTEKILGLSSLGAQMVLVKLQQNTLQNLASTLFWSPVRKQSLKQLQKRLKRMVRRLACQFRLRLFNMTLQKHTQLRITQSYMTTIYKT